MGWTAPRSGAACPGGDVRRARATSEGLLPPRTIKQGIFFGPASRYLEHAVPERSYQAEPPMSWRCDFMIFDKLKRSTVRRTLSQDRPGAREGAVSFPLTAEIMSKGHSVPP